MNSKKQHKIKVWFKDFSNPWKTKYRIKTIQTFLVVDDYGFLLHDETLKKLDTILRIIDNNEKVLITGWQVLDWVK